MSYTFNVTQQQNYYLYAYVNCAASSNDAFWICVDDGDPLKSNGNKTTGGYAWQGLYAKLSAADKSKYKLNLAPGEHTVYIYVKEPDAKVALICVSNTDALSDFKTEVADIDLSNISTGIRTINFEQLYDDNATWYDLSGRKLFEKPANKGIYIVNGKKVVIK